MGKEKFLIWQYRTKPKALQTIKAINQETDSTFSNVIDTAKILNINEATGWALDYVGRHVGIGRILSQAISKDYFGFLEIESSLAFNVGEFYRYGDALNATVRLSDSDYRFFIRAKIKKNYQTGTIENIAESVQFLFGKNSNVIDNQDMSMNLIVNVKHLNSLILYAVMHLDIVVRPIGVLYRYLILTNDEPFGFNHDPTSYGFGVGKFVRLQEIGIQNESN